MMEKHAMAPFIIYCGKLCTQILYMARLEAFWPLMTNRRTTHTRDVELTKTLGSSFGGSGLCSKFPGKCLLPLVWNKTPTFLKSPRNAPVPSLPTEMGWFRWGSGGAGTHICSSIPHKSFPGVLMQSQARYLLCQNFPDAYFPLSKPLQGTRINEIPSFGEWLRLGRPESRLFLQARC